jgi:hypothetical protein
VGVLAQHHIQARSGTPFLHAAATRLREHDDREQFLAGVDIFLAGITTLP